MCGAVLIAPDLALTAAHCTTKYSLNQYDFVLSSGKHELFKNEISQQDRHAEKVYTHPHYFTSSDSELNDISLLKFQPFELDPSTQPIQLPGVDFKIDMSINPKGIITGWGCTYEGCNGAVSPFLQEVHVPILENSDCKKAYPSIRDSMICAAEAEGGKDSCQGDSGGPMVLEEDSQKTLIGLVSWGIGCACKGYPGVYTRVTSYLKWIQDGIDNKIEPDTTQPPPGENTPDHNEREENNSNIFQPDVWATAEAYLVICILAMLF
ncbi:unnamed protein product [Allacma fusca]|uniref:Vitamin K-dependent protein C n=1 Tax=Allacma fusca TaxID=39272 RepID=A0A8J2J9X1_9HEXA|nr:unnamed protein product [Allacma fusca]